MKKITFVLLCFIALFIFTQANAKACGCPGPSAELAEEFMTASAVFSGEVVSREYVPFIIKRRGAEIKVERLLYKFKVDRLWKGNLKEEVIMPTSVIRYSDGSGSSGSNCIHGYFRVGKKYLIYADGSTDKLEASVCGRTKLIEEAETDVKELEKLTKESEKKQKEQKQ